MKVAPCLCLCAVLCGVAIGTDSKPLVLTTDEQKAVAQAVQTQQSWQKNLEQAEGTALNAPLKREETLAAIGNMQKAFAMREVANSKLEALLSAHRLAHSCADCVYGPDWKSLIKPEVKP